MKWGIRWEIGIVIVIILCLLIATLGLSELGLLSGESEDDGPVIYTGNDGNSYSYSVLESELEEAGSKYYNDKYTGRSNSNIYINYSTLKNNGYIDKLEDENGRICTGYVEITTSGSIFGYVKCNRYRTGGYDSSHE